MNCDAMSEQAQPVNVFEFLTVVLEQTASIAWQKMGLQPDFATGQINKDLDQCKAAIDATAALAQIVENQLDETDKRQMQNLVRDLRINFVEHSK